MTNEKLSKKEIEQLAFKIRDLLINYDLGLDVLIYFNNKRINCVNPLKVEENINAKDYFDYVNPNTLSMSFEGGFYYLINYSGGKLLREFDDILNSYDLHYELGNAWNLTLYFN